MLWPCLYITFLATIPDTVTIGAFVQILNFVTADTTPVAFVILLGIMSDPEFLFEGIDFFHSEVRRGVLASFPDISNSDNEEFRRESSQSKIYSSSSDRGVKNTTTEGLNSSTKESSILGSVGLNYFFEFLLDLTHRCFIHRNGRNTHVVVVVVFVVHAKTPKDILLKFHLSVCLSLSLISHQLYNKVQYQILGSNRILALTIFLDFFLEGGGRLNWH